MSMRGALESSVRGRGARSGAVLVLFALIVFGIMGFAALVIDLGVARLTQRQMQVAADGMALEVLRERDLARDVASEADWYQRDQRRRTRNARIASWHFMQRPVLGNEGDVQDSYGAGAYIVMTGGTGAINASPLVLDAGFSVPRPRSNYGGDGEGPIPLNLQQGDIVSGTFYGHADIDEDGIPEGALGPTGDPFDLEATSYKRVDFEPSEAQDAPFGSAVVARLRRTLRPGYTSDPASTDDLVNVSSSGPTIPFFFGLGTTMHGGDPNSEYVARFHGIGVRATSIADALPAVRAGVGRPEVETGAFNDGNGVGIAPFVLQKWFWNDEAGFEDMWNEMPNGDAWAWLRYNHEMGALETEYADAVPAAFLVPAALRRVGDRIPPADPEIAQTTWNDPKNWETGEAYAPVVRRRPTDEGWSDRIVGFVRVRTESVYEPQPDTGELRLAMKLWRLANERSPGMPWVAPRNASALFDGDQVSKEELAQDVFLGNIQVWSWGRLLRELATLRDAVRAPALVR